MLQGVAVELLPSLTSRCTQRKARPAKLLRRFRNRPQRRRQQEGELVSRWSTALRKRASVMLPSDLRFNGDSSKEEFIWHRKQSNQIGREKKPGMKAHQESAHRELNKLLRRGNLRQRLREASRPLFVRQLVRFP